MSFTVVICTKDRCASLTRCLESLANQLHGAKSETWDVLVVDNASSDGTSEGVRALEVTFSVALQVMREERLGLAIARNTGLREARGEVVVFVDDDVTFHEGWVKAWEDAFSDSSVAAAGGPIIPVFPDAVPAWYREGIMAEGGATTGYYHHGEEVLVCEPRAGVGYPFGGNMAIRRSRALQVDGFREDLGLGKKMIPAEETDLFSRMRADGAKILYMPAPSVNHHLDMGRTNLKHWRRWHRGSGRAYILI